VGLLTEAVQAQHEAALGRGHLRLPSWLVVACCYLAVALYLTAGLWASPGGRVPANSNGNVSDDIYLSVWCMRYAAAAVQHGHLPALVTTALGAPQGVNLMWNTSTLLPAVVLAPLTLATGPVVSLTLLLTLGFAGSAMALFVVLRRWGAGLWPAVLGGAVYGFSPALRQAADFHYHLQFAVLAPLIADAALRLVTGRGRPLRTGAWLGLLAAAQVFIAEEVLADAALAALVMIAVLAVSRPRAAAGRLGQVAAGALTAAGVFALLCAYPLWTQLRGPLAEKGIPWVASQYGNVPASFVTAPPAMALHGPGFAQFVASTGQHAAEYFGYLGWPLLAAVLGATAIYWADLRIRVAGLATVLLEVLSLGTSTTLTAGLSLQPSSLPWYWLERLPVLSQMLPDRLSIVADGTAAVTAALALDRLLRRAAAGSRRWHRVTLRAVAATATVTVLLPLLPLPVTAEGTETPTPGWTTVVARLRLPPGAAVLQLPMIGIAAMASQSISGANVSLDGGYCIAPAATGVPDACAGKLTLTRDQQLVQVGVSALIGGLPAAGGPAAATLRAALTAWHPAAVLALTARSAPLGQYLTGMLGPPDAQADDVLGWRLDWSG
jgi:hypothetical protein